MIPLTGEMSAKQTKGCQNSEEFAPAVDKHQIIVGTGLAPVRNKLHINHIGGQPQGLSLRILSNEIVRGAKPSSDEEGGAP